jgi:hypothetical protein
MADKQHLVVGDVPAGDNAGLVGAADLQALDVGLRQRGGVCGVVLQEDLHRQGLDGVAVLLSHGGQRLQLHHRIQ